MIILACILARFNFQDHVNLRSAHSGCSSTVYIVQLACLEHAESTRRSHRDDSVLMRLETSSLQNSDVPRAVTKKNSTTGHFENVPEPCSVPIQIWTHVSFLESIRSHDLQQLCALGVATGMIKGFLPQCL